MRILYLAFEHGEGCQDYIPKKYYISNLPQLYKSMCIQGYSADEK